MGNFKGTKGIAKVFNHSKKPYAIVCGKVVDVCYFEDSQFEKTSELRENAKLIADAFNTINKCDLFPSELLEQRDELLESLNSLYYAVDSCVELTPEILKKAKSAIEKVLKQKQ